MDQRTVTVDTWVSQFFGLVMEVWRLNLAVEWELRAYFGRLKEREAVSDVVLDVDIAVVGLLQTLRPVAERMRRLSDDARRLLTTFGPTMPRDRAQDTVTTYLAAELLVLHRGNTVAFYDEVLASSKEKLAEMGEDDMWTAPAMLLAPEQDVEGLRAELEEAALAPEPPPRAAGQA